MRFWVLCFACCAILAILFLGLLKSYEHIFYDLRFSLRPPLAVSEQAVIIEISDDTLKNLNSWPIPRDFHASLVDVLKEKGVKKVVFDIIFEESTFEDDIFAQAIADAGNVYLPLVFTLDEKSIKGVLTSSPSILASINRKFSEVVQGAGHINAFVDEDGKVRRAPLFIKYQNNFYPQISLLAACDTLGLDIRNVQFLPGKVIIDNKLVLPACCSGGLAINYPGKWGEAFKHFSYFEILKSYAQEQRGEKPLLDLSALQDKVCFVGLTAAGTSDFSPTPVSKIYPMLGSQASIFSSIITNQMIVDVGLVGNALIGLMVFFLSLWISLRLSALRALLGILGLAAAVFLISTALFIFFGIWTGLFLPLLIIVVTYVACVSYRFFSEIRKRELLEKELEIARTIQQNFLPDEMPTLDNWEVAAFMQAAKFVAGDLYDVLPLDEKHLGVLIGDVSGKGAPAALIMAKTISLFRLFAREGASCAQVLEKLTAELCGKFSGRFVTSIYLRINKEGNDVIAASAGHEPLLVYRLQNEGKKIEEIDLRSGLPLGVLEEGNYEEVSATLNKGDKLIFFSDGLSEARNKKGQDIDFKEIENAILETSEQSAKQTLEALKKAVFRFSKGAVQHDDITIIVIAKK
ncbi:MAG: CHASE2 domain-containing protein [Candidatus Aceula meridiana]|nr:CHASE2 domain-containing protein [Candidatus Aceula meridiana]